ncbi:MAG: Nif3-like dinuclear metal center hexameric protein [Bacteroidales bacterium]|nr:Nif3-like dinuclear metal center hexameric protein [Bacteroidales bacterium]
MIYIKTITSYLDKEFPLADQEDWDNCGLLIGNAEQEITSALLCVDITEDIVEEAVLLKCGLIIAHHPIIFGGLKRITGKTYVERIVQKVIKYNIAIYAIHTNLDNHINGLNRMLAEKLGMTNLKILRPKQDTLRKIVTFCPTEHAEKVRNAIFEAGAGQIGNYDSCSYNTLGEGSYRANAEANPYAGETDKLHFEKEVKIEAIYPVYLEQLIISSMIKAHPYEEVAYDILLLGNTNKYRGSGIIGNLASETTASGFLEKVKTVCGMPVIKYNGDLSQQVTTIALCGGSGSFLIQDAMKAGAQVFLTADLKYHDYFLPEGKMLLGDIGHYESEQFSKDLIAQVLMKKFPNFAALKTKTNSNPVKYL